MKKIVMNHVVKNFFTLRRGKVEALKDINLIIEPGKFFVLLGPSGCGKSTLLNIIAGIEKPSSGEILFDEQKIVSNREKIFLSPRQRDVAMVFQSYALYPHMSVFDNIAFPLKIGKLEKSEIKKKVEQVAEILEISQIMEAKPSELSGGQRQRVALGRAIVREPSVLLLDEPLSNLDALLRISMRSELKQIQRRIGVTTIYVTHDQTEAMSLGDNIAVLKDGEIQQLGTPEQIYKEPANLFVARFMGTPPMNIIEGQKFEQISEKLELKIEAKTDEIYLGIRPEHLNITSPEKGIFQASVNLVGSQGNERLIYLSLNDQEIICREYQEVDLKEDQKVGITFDADKVFVFLKKDGSSLNRKS
ncbi:MAG: ABC transporter ATP-binding protein [Calditrichaeota bacterium]|nr:ABC transporter ATP-binding protein [Calditrichota bacterium]RQW04469.1 MAG: ABC transporter ATP-binding protein [Calditrichota bacterium]